MKQAVKSLIKSPAAFLIVVLIIVLVLLFTVRAVTGRKIISKDKTDSTEVALADQQLAKLM